MPGMPPMPACCWPSSAARASGVRPPGPAAPGPRSGVMGGVSGPVGGLLRSMVAAASGSSGLYT